MADVTSVKISTTTRDRLRALGSDGKSLEYVVIAALEEYESRRFWEQAAAAVAAETPTQRKRRQRAEVEVDAWMGRLR